MATKNVANSTIVVNANGVVDYPLQPCFSASLNNVTGMTFAGALADRVIVFDTEDHDVGGHYNNATGVFTAPVTGCYFFCWALNPNPDYVVGGTAYDFHSGLFKNGTMVIPGDDRPTRNRAANFFGPNAFRTTSGSGMVSCAATDTIDVRAWLGFGATIQYYNYFCGCLVC